ADRGAASVHHDADSTVQDEMHGVGRIPLAYDDFVRLNLNPPAMLDQLVSILCTAERFGKPLAQGAGLAVTRLVRLDNRVLTRFKGGVEIGRHNDVRNKPGGSEGVFHVARETREYHLCAALVSDLLDLREAECRGRVDSSDEPKIEQQEAALLFCKQCIDLLVEPVGRAEK